MRQHYIKDGLEREELTPGAGKNDSSYVLGTELFVMVALLKSKPVGLGDRMSPASAIRAMALRLGVLHVGPVGFGETRA